MTINFLKSIATATIVSTSLLVLTACNSGPLGQFSHRQKLQQPQSQQQTGLLVEGVSTEQMTTLLEKFPKAEFRILNPQHGLYEVFGISSKELHEKLPEMKSQQNLFFQLENKSPQDILSLSTDKVFEALQTASTGEKLNNCKTGPKAPKAILKVNNVATEGTYTLERPRAIVLNGSESFANAEIGGDLKFGFAVAASEDSHFGQKVFFQPEVHFRPDALGLYRIIMVVQDKDDVCTRKDLLLTITSNPQMQKVDPSKTLTLERFHHLDELKANKAWELSEGGGIKIAIIDSGVNYNHPDLNINIAINKNEIPNNGLDDDLNGFADDVFGYDFANSDAFAYDDHGHGSHVAGLAAAATFGMARKAEILPIKALGPAGGDAGSIIAAIYYAVDSGAQIINMSLGSYQRTLPLPLLHAITYAEKNNVLVVAASGNGDPQFGFGLDAEQFPSYPSSLPNANIVSVASKGVGIDALAPYSNYGKVSVDIVAPGGSNRSDLIQSCYYENPDSEPYKGLVGTSMASPLVAGVAAQVWAVDPLLTALQVKDILLTSGRQVEAFNEFTTSGRVLDAYEAVKMALPRPQH